MAEHVNLYLRRETRTVFAKPPRPVLPVTVVTGLLGAGKTTLLKHILENKQKIKVAALVNDYAALNVDKELVARHGSRAMNTSASGVVELTNGCLCCSLAQDTAAAMWHILQGEHPDVDGGGSDVDYVVMETSGVSDPGMLILSR